MKLATLTFTSLAVLGALFLLLRHVSALPPADLDAELQRVVSEWVLSDRSVKNCVVSVMRGDGSVAWSVVAGKAHDGDQAPMTRDTPIYIASISKLYTAR